MIRYLAALICVISFSASYFGRAVDTYGSWEDLSGREAVPREPERRGVSVWCDEAASAPHKLMVLVIDLHAVVRCFARSSVELQGN